MGGACFLSRAQVGRLGGHAQAVILNPSGMTRACTPTPVLLKDSAVTLLIVYGPCCNTCSCLWLTNDVADSVYGPAPLQGAAPSLTVQQGPLVQITLVGVATGVTIVYPDVAVCLGVDAVLLPVPTGAQEGT